MSKAEHAAVLPRPHQTEAQYTPTPGTILVAFTSSLACWFVTGIIGYISSSSPFKDDITIMVVLFWLPQAIATVYLVFTVGT
jgi:hypothetical protein